MNVNTIVVVGSGLMGRGIAQVAALGGYQVSMSDVSEDVLEKALGVIRANLDKGVKLGKVNEDAASAALGRIKPVVDLSQAAAQADLVIEAVPENMELKCKVFRQLDEACPPHAILATNTSSMSVTEIGAATKRQDKVIGTHFFNPAHIMKLVELNRGLETSDETVAVAEEVCKRMGKEPVRINEYPGGISTRLAVLIGNEAFNMVMEGVATPQDIDKAVKLGLNFPMGPFELVDLIGLDTRLSILEYMHKTLGDRFRPSPLLVKYVKGGRLGRKVGKGVYDYTNK